MATATGKPTPESRVMAECATWLRLAGFMEITSNQLPRVAAVAKALGERRGFFWRNNTGGMCKTYKGRKSFTSFGIRGMPDYWLVLRGGQLIGIECKAEKGRLNPSQKQWREVMEAFGMTYLVMRTREDLDAVTRRD